MLKQRVITALFGIPLLIIAVWFDQPLPWFTVLIAICGALAVLEFYKLVGASKVIPLTYFGLAWTVLFIISGDARLSSVLESYSQADLLKPFLFTSAILLSLVWLVLRRQKENAFASWAWTMAGILYLGWLLSYLVALRSLDDTRTVLDEGRNWVFFATVINLISDSAAFFIGKAIGRHRLAPSVSPGKTWEGAIGGLLGAIIVSLFFVLPTPLNLPLKWWQAIVLGLMVSIFGQLGDLAESLFKRNMGVKDSGRLFPGHGGMLDRIDSVIFAGVVVYYYVVWTIH